MFNDAYLSFNSVDLSAHVKSIEVTYEAEALDDTAMNDTSRSQIGGLKTSSFTVTFNQDIAGSAVDDTVFARVGTSTAFEIRHTDAAVGPANPKFTGNCIPTSYSPMSGEVGSLATATLTCVVSGALTRATS